MRAVAGLPPRLPAENRRVLLSPVSGLHPSISGRVGTVTYVKIGCKFETVACQLEAEASICSIKIEQATRHITVHNVYYPECDGEGEWLK